MRIALLFADKISEVRYGVFRISNQLRFGLRPMIFLALNIR